MAFSKRVLDIFAFHILEVDNIYTPQVLERLIGFKISWLLLLNF
jgi:hypothetical protein